MDRGTRKMRSFSKDAERLLSSRLTQALSLTAVTVGITKAFQAADAFEASQRKLAATAKITGQNIGFLQVTAQQANREFGLGSKLANEYAIEVSKLTSKAGQIEQTGEAIGALLNLGAGRGYNATQTLEAVRQAILGIDEGTDKLFGKNPSVIYAEFARQVGISAGKMSDGEKALALLSAAMDDGGKVAGEYAKFLESPAGQTERLRIKTEEAAAGIGRSMQSVRVAVIPVLAQMAEGLAKFVGGIQILGVDLAVFAAKVKAGFAGIWSGQGSDSHERAIQNLERVRAAAEKQREEIVKTFTLSQDITGPTNPVIAAMDNIRAATEAATEAAKELATALDRAMRGREFAIAGRRGSGGGPGSSFFSRQNFRNLQANAASNINTGSVSTRSTPGNGAGGIDPSFLGGISSFFKGVGSQIAGLAAQFGPMALVAAALSKVFEGLMEVLGPLLEPIIEALKDIGRVIAPLLVPALKFLTVMVEQAARVVSYFMEGLGWLLRAIGKAVNWLLPGNPANGLVEWGQSMIDAARASRKATEETERFAAALSNVPNVISIARLRHGLATGAGGTGGYGGGNDPLGPTTGKPSNPPLTIVVNVAGSVISERDLGEVVGRAIDRAVNRGGTTRFAVALS